MSEDFSRLNFEPTNKKCSLPGSTEKGADKMPINKTGVKKDGKLQYRVRVNYTDAAGKAHQVERTAYGNAEAVALEQ